VSTAVQNQDLLKRTEVLNQNTRTNLTEDQTQELEELDRLFTEATLEPEQKMAKPYKSWWSKELKNAHFTVKYWRTVRRLEKKALTDEELLNSILKQIPPDHDIFHGQPNSTTNKQLLKARKYCTQCRNNSYKLRQDFLEQLADELMEEDDTQDRAVIVHKIRDAESKR
jgi:hypothetical protein